MGWPAADEHGIVAIYANLIDGLVADRTHGRGTQRSKPTSMLDSPAARRRAAEETLRFALALG